LDESSVSAAIFHKAFSIWNSPPSDQTSSWVSIGDSHWELGECIGHGDISDVYTGQRARWPTELAILKLLRDSRDAEMFDNEWESVKFLQQSNVLGADNFTSLIPQPIIHGKIITGSHAGYSLSIFRWISGFRHTFVEVLKAYPHGIPPRASIWIWRRILETLSFIHSSGMVHGAVLPSHLLIQENDHGVRLVGYGCAGRPGEKLRTFSQGFETFYPRPMQSYQILTSEADLAMSARCVIAILGGDPENASLPIAVPSPLAAIIKRIALTNPTINTNEDAWTIREELGEIAKEVFGPPQFIPIVMST
jgi:serine/threonine protein kinase